MDRICKMAYIFEDVADVDANHHIHEMGVVVSPVMPQGAAVRAVRSVLSLARSARTASQCMGAHEVPEVILEHHGSSFNARSDRCLQKLRQMQSGRLGVRCMITYWPGVDKRCNSKDAKPKRRIS